jgi:hypothetical protein
MGFNAAQARHDRRTDDLSTTVREGMVNGEFSL